MRGSETHYPSSDPMTSSSTGAPQLHSSALIRGAASVSAPTATDDVFTSDHHTVLFEHQESNVSSVSMVSTQSYRILLIAAVFTF